MRGQRRYLRGVPRRAASFDLDLRPDMWWDLWHYHQEVSDSDPDLRGRTVRDYLVFSERVGVPVGP